MPLTQKQKRIILNSLKKTDSWWRKFNKRVEYDILHSDGYEDFLERTKDYTTNNILVGMSEELSKQVVESTNFNKLKRRALVRQTIENNVANLVTDIGDDLKYEIKALVKRGYDLGYHPNQLAPLIRDRNLEALYIVVGEGTYSQTQWDNLPPEERVKYIRDSKIKRMSPEQRSKLIARTEVKRAQNIVNYLEAKGKGAKGFKVFCRPDCCEHCAEVYADITGSDYSDLSNSNNGQLIGGNVKFEMEDTDKLPPFHPNCNCNAVFEY